MFTVAAFSQPNLLNSIFSKVMALPFHLYSLATQVTNPPEEKQWGTALVLLMVVLFFVIIGTH
jgi:phosphate transport system permease protein